MSSEHRTFERDGHRVHARLDVRGGVELRITREGYRPDYGTWIDTPAVFVPKAGCATVRGRWKPYRLLGITLQGASTLDDLADKGIAEIDLDFARRGAALAAFDLDQGGVS